MAENTTKESSNPFAWAKSWKWADAAKRDEAAAAWVPSRAAERTYERQLVSAVKQVQQIIISGLPPQAIQDQLRRYAEIITPWTRQCAANMVIGVNRKSVKTWRGVAGRAGIDMRRLIASPGIGSAVREAIDNNVKLIQQLIFDETDRVAKLARESLIKGTRAEALAAEIADISSVGSLGRARVIAHTEISKAGTALTKARAESIGSKGYIWRTTRDGDTRESHRAMEGQFVPWGKPPKLDGMTGHAGEFPNCRCYPEPVIPREDGGVYKPALPTKAVEKYTGAVQALSAWERQQQQN